MLEQLKTLIRDCLTENDNSTYCPFRVGGAALSVGSIPTFVGGSIYNIIKAGHFDAMDFAGAFTAMMGGITVLAAGVAIKARSDGKQ